MSSSFSILTGDDDVSSIGDELLDGGDDDDVVGDAEAVDVDADDDFFTFNLQSFSSSFSDFCDDFLKEQRCHCLVINIIMNLN